METKKTLQIPEGMQFSHVDEEGVIHLKPKEKKYPMSNLEALEGKPGSYISITSNPVSIKAVENTKSNEDRNIVASKEMAEGFLAMMQLVTICDAWNEIDGFVPDWGKGTTYYCINNSNDGIIVDYWSVASHPLVFSCREKAEQFLKAFPELLEKAKRLL